MCHTNHCTFFANHIISVRNTHIKPSLRFIKSQKDRTSHAYSISLMWISVVLVCVGYPRAQFKQRMLSRFPSSCQLCRSLLPPSVALPLSGSLLINSVMCVQDITMSWTSFSSNNASQFIDKHSIDNVLIDLMICEHLIGRHIVSTCVPKEIHVWRDTFEISCNKAKTNLLIIIHMKDMFFKEWAPGWYDDQKRYITKNAQ